MRGDFDDPSGCREVRAGAANPFPHGHGSDWSGDMPSLNAGSDRGGWAFGLSQRWAEGWMGQ